MKKLLLALMILLVTLFAITSCGKDNENDPAPEVQKFPEGSVVWLDSTSVSIIPGEGVTRDHVASLKEALDEVIDTAYISSIYAEKTEYEIVVGYVEDREVSVKAYRLLERMEKDGYFDARYVIYARDNSVGIAYDENKYTTLQARDYAIDYFIENYVEGREYIAFGAGNRVEDRVDLIEEQELIDGAKMSEAWDRLFIEAGGETNPERAAAIVDAFKSWHGVYNENVVGWYANLYDPVTGGFYISNSGRNVDGFLPDIESTVQALNAIASLGMADHVGGVWAKAVPDWMRNQLIAFAKGLQSSKNGYFYHPQWTQEMVDNKISRRGRDLGWATSLLGAFGSAPTYDAPDGTKGDGVTVEEFWESVDWYGYMGELPEESPSETSLTISLGGSTAAAVSKVIAVSDVQLTASDNTDYLANHENFYNYMWSLPLTDGMSYTIGNDFNATRSQIKAKSKALGVYTEDPSKPYYNMTLCDIWVDYFNAKVNPENGLWEKEANFAGTNGFMKLNSSYTDFGAPLPYPMEAAESCIKGLTSSEDPSHVCHNYNLWVSLNGIKDNVKKCYADDPETRDAVLDYIQEALLDGAVDMVNKTRERVSKFQNEDGGFRYHHNMNGGSSQGMPVSLNIAESGINATSICMGGNWNNCFNAFGFTRIGIFGEADAMRFIETLEGLGPVQKYEAESVTIDFEDGALPSYFVPMRGASLDVVEYDGSNRLVMGVSGAGEAGKTWPGMDITKTSAANSGDYMVIEGDFTFCNEADGYYEFYINSDDSKSAKPMYFQFFMNGNTISIKDVRFGSGKSFVVGTRGKTFHLRLEYFLNSKGQSALRINSDGKYLGTITNAGGNTTHIGGAAPTRLSRIEFAGSYKNGGLIYVDNFNFGPALYVDEDGDEAPDKFPDNEGAGGSIIVDGGMGSPVDFEKITAVDPAVIKPSSATASAIVDHNGSKALELTFTADASNEIFIYKTKAAEAGADTLVFEADITPTITGQYSLRFRAGTNIAYSFTINNSGGAYDADDSWQPNFAEVQKTINIRMEYGAVESGGKTYMQTKVYVDGELKFESKLIDKYLASDSNSIRSITSLQIAENNKNGEGKLYLDNVELAEVVNTNITLPEDVVDEDGFIKFENMEAIDPLIAKAKLDGSITVGELEDKVAMILVYNKSKTEEFTLYPTKSEANADTLTLEANVRDTYNSPRFLKIYAGSRLVYDFRINGSGGIASESNNVWWGANNTKTDVTYNFKVTVTVVDGKVDVKVFIDGTEVKRPSAYGTKLDLTAEADLIEDISHIVIVDNEQTTTVDTGKIYLTDYRFTKTDEIAESDEPEHEHVFVDGKCECGESDPDYVPEGEKDYSEYYHSFDGVAEINTSFIRPGSTGTVITVGQVNGSDAAKLEFLDTAWDEVLFQPSYKEDGANTVILDAEFTFDVNAGSGNYMTFYLRGGASEKVYALNITPLEAGGFSADDNYGFKKTDFAAENTLKLRIEYKEVKVDGVAMVKEEIYLNGTLVNESEPFAMTENNAPSKINRIDIMGSKTLAGSVYVDNYAFLKIVSEVEEITTTPGGDEPEHEHVFVDGKCECGEADPDYVPDEGGEGTEPLTPDASGVISFENMTAVDNPYIVPTVSGTVSVVSHGGSKQLEMKYTADSTEKFKFTPTLKESGADEMIFEADLTDSFGKPRTFTIYAGTTKVYDFRINGSGGFAAEGNQVWWGGGKYTLETPYKLKITAKVTDGKLDLNLYVNDELATRPSAYGTQLDITAADNLIELITHIEIVDGTTIASASAGSVYADNLKFVLLNTSADEGGSVDGGDEPEHEHLFVEGKCECGESDPDYVAPHEHVFVDGKCECGETDPDYVAPSTPDIRDGAITFEDIESLGAVGVSVSNEEAIVVSPLAGGKALKVDFAAGATEKITITPNTVEGADKFVFEFDITNTDAADTVSTDKAQYDIKFYSLGSPEAANGTLYDFRLNGATFMCEGGDQWLGSVLPADDTTFRLTIELWVEGEALCMNVLLDGNEVERKSLVYGKSYTHVASGMSASTISSIYKVEIVDSRAAANGTVYFDNIYCAAIKSAE